MRIGFINPSSDYLHDPFRGDPHTHFHLLTLLESRFQSQIDPLLIDLRGIKKEFAANHIPECDIYLHSVYTLDYNEQLEIINNLREVYPKAKHIAGGPHVNIFPDECLKVMDSIILGDGEESIIKVIKDYRDYKLEKAYKQEEFIDINKYPVPLRKYLPKSAIAKKGIMTLKNDKGSENVLGTTVVFTRGCPYSCSFCEISQIKDYNPSMREREPNLIKEEITYLQKEYGIGGINLLDEIGIPLSRKKAISRLEAIADTSIKWRGQCRVDGITPELAKLAKESGCVALGLGVESVNQNSLDIINKRIKVEKAKQTIKILKDNNIEARVYLILGLPGEPEDIVDKTWNFIRETEPEMVYLSIFTIRPGTEVFYNPKKFGIKEISTDWKHNHHMYGRYNEELPKAVTFEYEKQTKWGRGFSKEEIMRNYIELQTRLREKGLSS